MEENKKTKYYLEKPAKILIDLKTTENGLSEADAERRLQENGKNKLKEAEHDSLLKKFFKALADPMIIMLIAAAAVQAIVTVIEAGGKPGIRDFMDVIVILIVVIINSILSLIQESKAEAAMDALTQMTAATSKIMRDGKVTVIKSEDAVVGDVVVLEAGDSVPADCRILEAHSLKAEEAALTGESVPVNKLVDILMLQKEQRDIPLGDRRNMLYSGSTIVYGRGKAVITATGMDTEMGRIADALSEAEKEQTPLQKKMSELSVFLTKLVIGICIAVFVVGIAESLLFSGDGFSWRVLGDAALDTFIAAIALAVETLGCTQIICSDKTGTLTQNKMTVVKTFTDDEKLLAMAMALCSDAEIQPGEQESTGEPTEAALVNYAFKIGYPKYEMAEEQPRIGEAPFDSLRKMMSTVHQDGSSYIQYTKGAFDVILERCSGYLRGGKVIPMTDELRAKIAEVNKEYADNALRVLLAAYRRYDAMPASMEPEDLEKDLVFIGLMGMIDPCRPEVYDAIQECREAGIRPVMITGDHKDTAVAIAKDLGIIKDASEAIAGAELDRYSDEELLELVPQYSVYARVQPEHKTRIVNAWQTRGMVTAMTGDGVNDAPSIKAADIGVGMGITGTDVTKGVADMVLADDNFATIVNAVEEGRKIYDNILKVLQFQLSTNMSEVLIMFLASILNFKILAPVHLLWINMVTDSLPGLALGMEKAESDLMKRKPRASTDGIFAGGAGADMIWQGVYIAIVEIASYLIGYRMVNGSLEGLIGGPACANAMAMVFVTASFAEMFCALSMRSRNGSIFSIHMLKNINWWLVGALVITTALTFVAVLVPGLQTVFGIERGMFTGRELRVAIALALTVIPVFEIGKAVRRSLPQQEKEN